MGDLIPGLPDDVALHCLIRTHYSDFSSISSVSKSWHYHLHHPTFLRHRKNSGNTRIVVAMAQAISDPYRTPGSKSYPSPPAYRLTLFEPETGIWTHLLPPPGCAHGLPMFCRLAGVGSELVLLGGWDPKTFGVSRSVFIYSFITATWRRAAQMPEHARSFFGCAVDVGAKVVYVAGGHNEEKNALKSVLAYDVAKDEWTSVADMAYERDECHAVVHRGKLHVIGGYCSEMQGCFEKSAEVLDLDTMTWGDVNMNFLDVATCHKGCVSSGTELYMCRRETNVAVRGEDGKWISGIETGGGLGEVTYVTSWGEKLLVIGTSNETSSGFVLDLKSRKWSKVAMPEKYSGNIQAGCCLEL